MNFEQLEARYRELVVQRQAGRIDNKAFEDHVGALRLQDAEQRWWQIDPASGQWLRWDGSQWQRGEPPRAKGSGPLAPPAPGAVSAVPDDGAMHKVLVFLQDFWRRFLDRMISPGEFLRQSRLPLALRSQGWWDALSVAGGALSGYIWFLYSSIRGMPHFTLFGMSGAKDVWYDFVPSFFLAALPFILAANRNKLLQRLDVLWTRMRANVSYAMNLAAGLIVGAIALNYLSPALFSWAFAFREGLDFATPLLMVGIPVGLALFRRETDLLIMPLQPLRQQVPKFVLVGVALAVPYALAFVLYRLALTQYELLHWNLILGILIPYVLMRNPQPVAASPSSAGTLSTLIWLLPGVLFLSGIHVPEAIADDCARDLFNLRDCLRTGGYAETMSGAAASAVSVLVNGAEIVRIFFPVPSGPALPPADSPGVPPLVPPEVPPQVPPEVPQTPADIEWTGADGRHNVLVWKPEHNGYVNILTGGLVAPEDVDKWKQNIDQTKQQTDDWRADNKKLTDAGLDAQSQALAAIKAQADARAAAAAEVVRIQQAAIRNGLWNPGGPGDIVGTSNKVLDDIWAGKPVDREKIDSMRRYTGDRITGAAAPESSLDKARLGHFYGATEGLQGTLREVLTGKNADGKATLAGAVTSAFGRLTAGIATGGASEVIYVGANMGYAQKDAADRGASDLAIFTAGVTTGVIEAAPTVLGGMATHYVPKFFPNVSRGVGEMFKPVGDAATSAISTIDRAVQQGSKSLVNRVSAVVKPLPGNLAATRAAVDRVLKSPSPQEIAKLYSEGGMDRLAQLQKANHLTAEEARLLNSHLARQVNADINSGMKSTINQFEKETGVKIDHAILGDSGSTARAGGNPKAKTDFDRTQVTKFNSEDVSSYATKKGISVEEANRELQQRFGNQLTENVDNRLRSNGFSRGTTDLDYKTYNGIGNTAGQADAYPPGFTGSRQAVQGRGTVFEHGHGGEIKTHNISGQAVVDQHGLNTASVKGSLPENPTRFGADEFHDFSKQQVASAAGHDDVKSLAKAMGRESDLSGRLDRMASNPHGAEQLKSAGFTNEAGQLAKPPQIDGQLAGIADEINKNPSEAMKILKSNGYDEKSFASAVKNEINNFHSALPDVPKSAPKTQG